ncbi:hypothetical protein LO762_02130 [Actinocorallia sp. API 0066]|uniref:hypothetical protein n=1 Tax=Actinocorallia sp. API 0066 TaxID=2896846 RepID=UPI001E4B4DE6|nr:hypothetical protein [Actinocorallia sp. API 0066]MCD0447999.1 hypothetical protein [Actinocorallia sp. API 0066]
MSEPSPGERIARALRRSPVHLDPSLESALPDGRRAELLAAIEAAPMPIYVIIVPLVDGGTWSDTEELITVVHDRLKRDGVYLTMEGYQQFRARRFGGTEEEQEAASSAARVPFFLDEFDNAVLADRLLKAVELIAAGNGVAEYEKATAHLRSTPNPVEKLTRNDQGETSPLRVTAIGLGVAAVAGLAVWRWRRTGRPEPQHSHPLILSRATLETARKADEKGLRKQAAEAVVAFGELVDAAAVSSGDARARELLALALDAYQAAGKVLDEARGVPDLAGVLVLVDRGQDALASARARAAGRKEIPPSALCFFNPLHGDATGMVTWRRLGTRDAIKVEACQACAKAVRGHRPPEALLDTSGAKPLPYYATSSLWARTGYGQFGDGGFEDGTGDGLIARVLRGDHRS